MEPDAYPTPTAALARVRELRAVVKAAEIETLQLAAHWADTHPDLDDEPHPATGGAGDGLRGFDPDQPVDEHIPRVAWDAGASLAAALGRATTAGDALIRDALVLRHRLPGVWSRVVAGQVEAWRARRIAQALLGAPADVATHLDHTLAGIADTVGPLTLDRLLDEAMLRLHPEDREQAQLEELDRRHATLHENSLTDTGIGEMTLRGDWKDLHDFDQALSTIAAELAAADQAAGMVPEPLDVRRARAVGVLADPHTAAALLDHTPAPKPRRKMTLIVHLSADALLGVNPLARCETTGRPMLDQQARDWCGRTDTHLTIQPVIDLNDHVHVAAYEIPDRLKTRADLIAGHCVFPYCLKPATRCDHDHGVPHATGGATCDCNLAPLCRSHHRLKTHAGWTYTTLETGVWLWSDPHGQQLLRDHHGTRDVTPPDRPINRGTGCRQPATREPVPRE